MKKLILLTLTLFTVLWSCKKKHAEPAAADSLTTSFSVNGASVTSYLNPAVNEIYINCPNDTASNAITYAHDIVNYDPNYPSSYYTLSIPYDSSVFDSLVKVNIKYPLLSNTGDSCSIGMDFSYTENGTAYSSIYLNNLTEQYVEFSKIVYGGQQVDMTTNFAVYYLTGNFTCIIQAGDTTLPLKVISNGNFTAKAYLRRD